MATHHPRTRRTLTLGPDDDGRLVSADEFASAHYLEPWKYERECGRLVVMPPDGQGHVEGASPWLRRLFVFWNEHPDLIERVVPNAWVRIDDGTDRIGDIGIYLEAEGTIAPIPDRVPELMFEIVSPRKADRERDYVKKRGEYHKLGIREYVAIDKKDRKVTVLSHTPAGYQERVLVLGQSYTSPLLPGLDIPLAEVFTV